MVEVLATAEQAQRLPDVLGEALCAAPVEHPGLCRIAWSITCLDATHDTSDGSNGLGADDAAFIREHLAPVAVWQPEDVNRSLGL